MKNLHLVTRTNEKGISSVEFAVVMPLLMLLFFVVFALSIHGFSVLTVATGVPLEARASGAGGGSLALLSAFKTTAAAGGPAIGGAPNCQRALYAQLDAAPLFQFPMLPEAPMRLHAGSVARNWQFYAGPPDDGCN